MLRILIADDEVLLTFALRQQLELHGCEVVGTAPNGQVAVETCCAARPDVVLMDIRMPVMDGLTATRTIMSDCSTCIMMMTAYGAADTAARVEAEGAMAYLTKPVGVEQILGAVPQAQARFAEFEVIRGEAADVGEALETRRLVEAAKRLLGTDCEEGVGFRKLSEMAERNGWTLRETAYRVTGEAGSSAA